MRSWETCKRTNSKFRHVNLPLRTPSSCGIANEDAAREIFLRVGFSGLASKELFENVLTCQWITEKMYWERTVIQRLFIRPRARLRIEGKGNPEDSYVAKVAPGSVSARETINTTRYYTVDIIRLRVVCVNGRAFERPVERCSPWERSSLVLRVRHVRPRNYCAFRKRVPGLRTSRRDFWLWFAWCTRRDNVYASDPGLSEKSTTGAVSSGNVKRDYVLELKKKHFQD